MKEHPAVKKKHRARGSGQNLPFNLFRLVRKWQGLKQDDLAKSLGISQQGLSAFEVGQCTLSEDVLLRLSMLVNINPLFASGEVASPFKRREVISFFCNPLQKNPLVLLADYCRTLKVLCLVNRFTVDAVYAFIAQDDQRNIFFIGNKHRRPFPDRNAIVAKLHDAATKNGAALFIYEKFMAPSLFKKLVSQPMRKRDLLTLFPAKPIPKCKSGDRSNRELRVARKEGSSSCNDGDEKILTRAECCAFLAVSESELQTMMNDTVNPLPYSQLVKGQPNLVRFLKTEVIQWVKSLEVQRRTVNSRQKGKKEVA